ncbi:histone H1-delta-like [Haliotis rufescens]|uniref:histone H1-delta-like n=1 Tax=Haliotis rufescens TaxID=6454 RepID=UPI001EB07ABD|nr:histone H1-delta-like [Haliotis rufescens]
MTDAAPAPAKKAAKKAAPKKPSSHPKYSEMIRDAISGLKERGGSSRQALLKYIMKNFKVGPDERTVNNHLKLALRAGVKNGSLKQSKGTGASGSFRLGDKSEAKKPKAKKATKAAKPKADKAKKTAKKSTPKKAKKPKPAKKSPAKKAAKPKAAKKSPAKKAAKPKAAKKSPKKKAAAKK